MFTFTQSLFALGLIILLGVVLFKQKISAFYDNMKGLSDEHKEFYKRKVIFILPLIFIGLGIYYRLTETILYNSEGNLDFQAIFGKLNNNHIYAFILISFGIISIFLRESKKKYTYFAKLSVLEANYGEGKGYFFHFLAYSFFPITFGILFLYLN
jgi:hypothetical protein